MVATRGNYSAMTHTYAIDPKNKNKGHNRYKILMNSMDQMNHHKKLS